MVAVVGKHDVLHRRVESPLSSSIGGLTGGLTLARRLYVSVKQRVAAWGRYRAVMQARWRMHNRVAAPRARSASESRVQHPMEL